MTKLQLRKTPLIDLGPLWDRALDAGNYRLAKAISDEAARRAR